MVRRSLFEASIACLRMILLPRLVVFAAEDHDVMVPVRLDAKKMVGVGRVPPQCVGHDSTRDTAGDDVAGVERQLRLKKGGDSHAGEAGQRIVRRDDDVLARHRVSIGLHAAGGVAEFVRLGVLVDAAPECDERLCQTREILTRMDAGLIREADARSVRQRNRIDVLRIEAQLSRQCRVGLELLRFIALVAVRRVQIPIHPLEAGIDVMLANDVVNRADGSEPRVPHRLRMGASESFHQLAQARVGHHRQVRARMARVRRGTPAAFEHDDAFAAFREEVRRSETGDSTADDNHIGVGIVAQPGKLRE